MFADRSGPLGLRRWRCLTLGREVVVSYHVTIADSDFHPLDAEAQAQVGRLALAANDHDTAIRAFRAVVALKPVDQAAAHTDLAESYFKAGRRAEARKQTLAALEIAPSYARAQDLLLDIAGARP